MTMASLFHVAAPQGTNETDGPATVARDQAPRYRRPSIAGWLAPLLLGPWPSILAVVMAYAFLGPAIPYVPRGVVAGVGLLLGALAGSVYIALVAVLDVLLLAVRLRTLPTGARGWSAMLVSPLAFLGAYVVVKPWTFWKGGPWTVLVVLAIPLVITAVTTRVLFGVRIAKR
jgi:hypothetical protein